MKTLLILGAGQSSPLLIRYLLERAEAEGWRVVVADRDPGLASERIAGHPYGQAIELDVTRAATPGEAADGDDPFATADAVVSLLPPQLQPVLARRCLADRIPLITASYTDPRVAALDSEAKQRGVLILNEMGLDPGIDHMASRELLDRLRGEGGTVEAFESYGSGVPAPESRSNPLGYAITWNPRNVVMAANSGAQYLHRGQIRIVPWQRVFADRWTVEVDGVGTMEAYPNRDSLAYRETFGLESAHTLIRGTLRYPGFCETWHQVVRLGLPNERLQVPGLADRGFGELVEMFLPDDDSEKGGDGAEDIDTRLARFLGLDYDAPTMERLRWLGLFSEEPIGGHAATPAEALINLLAERLTLPPGGRDMVVLLHEVTVRYPTENDADGEPRRERITATLVEHGEADGITAMSRTVGLPAAVAATLVMRGELDLTGCVIPTDPRIYRPVLAALEKEGVRFQERRRPLD